MRAAGVLPVLATLAPLCMLPSFTSAAITVSPSSAYSKRGSTIFNKRGFYVGAAFVGNLGWDPANLASGNTLVPFRHAELKHGRVAMLAALGWPVQELVHPALVALLDRLHPQDLTPDGFSPSILHGGLDRPEVWPALAFAMVVGSAFELREIEMRTRAGLAFNEWAPDSVAGDVRFDPLNIATDLPVTDRFELQEAEMINGRLAMLALVAYAFIEGVVGVPIVRFSLDVL